MWTKILKNVFFCYWPELYVEDFFCLTFFTKNYFNTFSAFYHIMKYISIFLQERKSVKKIQTMVWEKIYLLQCSTVVVRNIKENLFGVFIERDYRNIYGYLHPFKIFEVMEILWSFHPDSLYWRQQSKLDRGEYLELALRIMTFIKYTNDFN